MVINIVIEIYISIMILKHIYSACKCKHSKAWKSCLTFNKTDALLYVTMKHGNN